MKALVGAFNQEKALVGAFSVIVQPVVEPMEHYTALVVPLLQIDIFVSTSNILLNFRVHLKALIKIFVAG